MESIGTLAGGIAHDFNNILNVIMGFTHITRTKVSENTEAVNNLDQVMQATERAADVVKQILAFSRMGTQEFQPVLISLLWVLALLLYKIKSNRHIHLLPRVETYPIDFRH